MRAIIGALAIFSCLHAVPASAQSVPDMVGTWSGQSITIVMGSGAHWLSDGSPAEPRSESKVLTIEIDGQDGRRFWGAIISDVHREPLIGLFRHHGRSWIAVDRDGYLQASMADNDAFEQCYAHTGEDHHSMVLSCTRFTRQ